jgi:ABC-type glycerol-3-phosphate transport system substrate-binding protein
MPARHRTILGWTTVSVLLLLGCRPADPNAQAESQTVTVWHWMTDKHEALEALAAQYKQQTGVQVTFDVYAPSDVYNQKVRAASQARRLPDVFGVLAEKHDLASFIKAGLVLDLTPYLEADGAAWRNRFYPAVLGHDQFTDNNEYGINPGYYGIPIDLMTVQMVYNKTLFRKAGLDPESPPKTWSELITQGKALKAAGIPPIISGFGEIWLIDCLASNYAFNILGEKKVIDTYRGKVPYTDPGWIRVLSLFQELAENDLWFPGITNLNNKEAEQMFANERAAIAFNGSWCVNVYTGMNPDLVYGVFPPPPASDAHPMRVWGSAGASLLVNGESPNREKAVAFLKWLTDSAQQSVYATKTRSVPANRACTESVTPVLADFARPIDTATHPSQWPIMEKPAVVETFDKGIQMIMIGEETPEQVAARIQAVKLRDPQ